MRNEMYRSLILGATSALLCVHGLGAGDATNKEPYHANIDPANFKTPVENPYYPLRPGTTYKYTEKQGDEVSDNVIVVTHDTKTILGVKCIVVHDTVTVEGKVKEETLDWMATDKDGNVWYFGEDTKEHQANGKVSTKGSWEAGVNGGEPGILMPGAIKIGNEPVRQEFLAGEAEDVGQIVEINQAVTVPGGEFKDCVKTKEWSLLEHDSFESKWYAKDVGFVKEVATNGTVEELISVTHE